MKYIKQILLFEALLLCLFIQSCTSSQKMTFFAEASVHSNEFWGKVIDQHGEPVSDADILYYAGGGYIGGGSGYGRLKSDNSGMFHITGSKGGSLNFREMKKEGYQIVIQPSDNLFYSWKNYPDSLIWTDYTKERPFIYQAWKYSEDFVDKTKLQHKGFMVIFKSGGTESSIDVFGGPRQQYNKDLTKGQLKVQLFRESMSSGKHNAKWQFVVTPLDGGIIKAVSKYTNEAPKEGYEKFIVFTQDDYVDANQTDDKYREVKSFFFTMKGGTIFGRLSFRLDPYYLDDAGILKVRCTINPTGERYLDSFDGWVQ